MKSNFTTTRLLKLTLFCLLFFSVQIGNINAQTICVAPDIPIAPAAEVQTFDDFTGAGFALDIVSTPGALCSDAFSIDGFGDNVAFGETVTTGDPARGITTEDVSTGGIYALDRMGGDFALWIQPGGSDFTPGMITYRLVNNTGNTIQDLMVSYDILSFNDQDRSNSFNFSHSADNSTYIDLSLIHI